MTRSRRSPRCTPSPQIFDEQAAAHAERPALRSPGNHPRARRVGAGCGPAPVRRHRAASSGRSPRAVSPGCSPSAPSSSGPPRWPRPLPSSLETALLGRARAGGPSTARRDPGARAPLDRHAAADRDRRGRQRARGGARSPPSRRSGSAAATRASALPLEELVGGEGRLADVARLALIDLEALPARRTARDRGLTIAQLFLHADIDPALSSAGAGDNGGIATLLVRLGERARRRSRRPVCRGSSPSRAGPCRRRRSTCSSSAR